MRSAKDRNTAKRAKQAVNDLRSALAKQTAGAGRKGNTGKLSLNKAVQDCVVQARAFLQKRPKSSAKARGIRDLQIAFSSSVRSVDVARQFDVADDTVAQANSLTAEASLERQLEILDEWIALSVSDDEPYGILQAVHCQSMMDSAQATVIVPTHEDANDEDVQMKAPWHILVTCRALVLVFQKKSFALKLVAPVIPCTDTTAGSMFSCWFEHPYVSKVNDKIAMIHGIAEVQTDIWAFDGAFANERFYFDIEAGCEAVPSVPSLRILCFNHRMNLVEVVLRAFFGKELCRMMTSVTNFMRGGLAWYRFVAILPIVFDKVDIEVGEPDVRDILHMQELMDYQLTQHKIYQRSIRKKKKGKRQERSDADYKKDWETHCELFNGPKHDGQRGHGLKVFVREPVRKEIHSKRLAQSFRRVVLRSLPCSPEEAKWTKLGPCTDW